MRPGLRIERLDGSDIRAGADDLAHIMVDCVAKGASLGFLKPLDPADALAFWQAVAHEVDEGITICLAAVFDDAVVGSVQIRLVLKPNQPHRAEIAKLMVSPDMRRRGIGTMLMAFAEAEARAAGRTLLVLDALKGTPAEALYHALGYRPAGTIPNYALFPDGEMGDTTIFYKEV